MFIWFILSDPNIHPFSVVSRIRIIHFRAKLLSVNMLVADFFTLSAFGYVRFLTFFGVIPVVLGFLVFHRYLTRYVRLILLVVGISIIVYFPWDLLALRDKVWYFRNYLNIWILGVPLEEYFFTILFVFIVSGMTIIFKSQEEEHVRPR